MDKEKIAALEADIEYGLSNIEEGSRYWGLLEAARAHLEQLREAEPTVAPYKDRAEALAALDRISQYAVSYIASSRAVNDFESFSSDIETIRAALCAPMKGTDNG